MIELLQNTVMSALSLLYGTAVWLVVSFLLAGLLRSLVNPSRMQRMLGNRKLTSIIKAIASGALLPICSCGAVPLGLGLYYSGAYLGPTLAFMTAAPALNPASLLLTYGFLGPQVTVIYAVTAIIISLAAGIAGNLLAGKEIHAPGLDGTADPVQLVSGEQVALSAKIRAGIEWGFKEMGAMVSKYVCYGLLLVGIVLTLVPQAYIQQFLGSPGLISIIGIAVFGTVMYVCAVGHIPFIAVLVASGAAPGVTITFLMTGAATNIPELISIAKLIGRRAAAIFMLLITGLSILAGYITNLLLLPDFVPFFNLDKTRSVVGIANMLISVPEPIQYVCAGIVIFLAGYSIWPQFHKLLSEKSA